MKVFRRPGEAVVKIASAALLRMLEFQQLRPHHPEAGGVLLGRHLSACRDVIIDEVTSPMPGDRCKRTAFHRSQEQHQRVIDDMWRSSEGTCLYLGEWHTHPETHPEPSRVDLEDWLRRLRTDHFEGPSLFFIIVGLGLQEVNAWEGFRQQNEIIRLPLAG